MGDGYAIRLNSVEYDAGDDRAALTALVMGAGAATARAGRRPGPGLTVTVGGTPEAATLSPGVCVVTDPVGGMYLVAFPNNVTKNLATRPGTGTSRNDLAVARIYDADVHSADTTLREVDFELVTGTASASPSTPTLPDGALLLDTLTVPATGTISVSQNGPRTVAAGGILPVASQAERDALTAYDGLVVYREDTDTFEARINGNWQGLNDPADTGWQSLTVVSPYSATSPISSGEPPKYRVRGGIVYIVGSIQLVGSPGSGFVKAASVPSQYAPAQIIKAPVTVISAAASPVVAQIKPNGDIEISMSGTTTAFLGLAALGGYPLG